MDYYSIVLRLVHIFSGVFWAGSAILLAGIIAPAVAAAGEEGASFMRRLVGQTRLSAYMSLSANLNVIAGALLFWRVSGRLNPSWLTSGPGLGLTLGSLAAIAAFIVGYVLQNRSSRRMSVIGAEIQASGGPPSADQLAEMQSLQENIRKGGKWTAILLAVAVIMMAIWRFLIF